MIWIVKCYTLKELNTKFANNFPKIITFCNCKVVTQPNQIKKMIVLFIINKVYYKPTKIKQSLNNSYDLTEHCDNSYHVCTFSQVDTVQWTAIKVKVEQRQNKQTQKWLSSWPNVNFMSTWKSQIGKIETNKDDGKKRTPSRSIGRKKSSHQHNTKLSNDYSAINQVVISVTLTVCNTLGVLVALMLIGVSLLYEHQNLKILQVDNPIWQAN